MTMKAPKRPVRDFKCVTCGVVIKGVKSANGEIRATDRPYTDRVIEPALCVEHTPGGR